MITRNIDIKTLDRYFRKLQKTMGAQAYRAQQAAARASIAILKREVHAISPYPPIDRGTYLNSFRVQGHPSELRVEVTNTSRHAKYVEGGRRRGARRPPPKVIQSWVRRKFGVSGKKAKSIAYVVGRKIGEKGIRKKPVTKSAMPDIKRVYLAELRRYNDKWVAQHG